MKKAKALLSPPLLSFGLYTLLILLVIVCLKYFTLLSAPVFFSLVIAYLFNPLVDYLEAKTPLSRSLIAAFLMVVLVFVFVFLIVTLLPDFIDRVKNAAEHLPQLLKQFSERVEVVSNYLTKNFSQYLGNVDIMGSFESMISGMLNNLSNILIGAFSSIYGVFVTLVFLILVPLFAYYFIKDYHKIQRTLLNLIPVRCYDRVVEKLRQLDEILSSFIRGQAIIVLILATLYSIGLSLIGLPFPVLIGIFSGLGDFIPYLGTIVGFIISLIIGIAYFQSVEKLLLIALVFGLIKGSENWFFYPKIVGREVGLHFVWVLVSIIVFGKLFGFWGLLVSIPASAGLKIFVSDLIRHYRGSAFFKKQ